MSTTSADTPKSSIVAANTVNDVIRAANGDSQIKTALLNEYGVQLQTAAKSPLGMVAGAAVGWLATHYGLTVDPGLQLLAAGAFAILGGDLWQWASAKWWPAKVATP